MNWKIIGVASLCTLFYSCVHEPKTYVAPVSPVAICDTINMSYKTNILPILKVCCYQCHSDSVTQNGSLGFDVETFSSLKQYLKLGYRGDGIYGSMFIHCIQHSLFARDMPPTYTIDSCSLGQIRSWIGDGAKDN